MKLKKIAKFLENGSPEIRSVAVGKNREGREWRWFPANWVGPNPS